MKRGTLIIMFLTLSFSVLSAQNTQLSNKPAGTWKFEAPYAPEGFNSGTIVLGLTEQKNTVSLSFTGSEYKLPGENVKVVNDSVLFSIYLEAQDIRVMLKMENDTSMTGKAVYSEGEVPFTLSKVITSEAEVKQ